MLKRMVIIGEFWQSSYILMLIYFDSFIGVFSFITDGVQKLVYKRLARHYLNDLVRADRSATLTSAAYHDSTRVLVTGYSCGSFFLHEMPNVTLIHSLR